MVNQDIKKAYADMLQELVLLGNAYAEELVREQIVLLNDIYTNGDDLSTDELLEKSEELYNLFLEIDTLSDRIGLTMFDIINISTRYDESRGNIRDKFLNINARKLLTFSGWTTHIVTQISSSLSQPVMINK